VTTFGAEQGIWRKTFYVLRRRALEEGPAAVLEPRSRRPRTSPSRLPDRVRARALDVRAALERSGLDHGPISVHDKMASMGLEAPSPAWLARLFRREGVARAEPSKRPRAAWRRFVYPAPNACWQLDATEYVLAGGRKAVIFQLQDDHWRLAVASLVAPGETSQAAIDVFDKGVAARGVPPAPARPTTARPSTPAGAESPAAWWSTCAPWASNPSPANPTGPPPRARTSASTRPCSATWTSSPWPTPSPSPRETGRPLRPHPATPSAPTRACPGASPGSRPGTPPRSPGHPDRATTPTPSPPPTEPARDAPAGRRPPHRRRPIAPSGERELTITRNGTVHIGGIAFLVRRALAGHRTTAIWDATTITFADVHGEVLIQYNWPPEGVTYVSHHPPDPTNQRGGRGRRRPQPSPKS